MRPAAPLTFSTEMRLQLIDELIEDDSKLGVELSPPTISHEGLVDARVNQRIGTGSHTHSGKLPVGKFAFR